MYFITPKNSETGKKFAEVDKLLTEAWEAVNRFVEKVGGHEFRMDQFAKYGGISAVMLTDTSDLKGWKEIRKGEFMPDKRTKRGKELQKEIDQFPLLSRAHFNSCIGWKEAWKCIGYSSANALYFGFVVDEKWNIKIPDDCTEVTTGEYKRTFTKESSTKK